MTVRRRRNPRFPQGLHPRIFGVSTLVVHNLLVHRVLRPPADAALNLISAVGLTAYTLRVGCTSAELGLDPTALRRGLETGSIAAGCCTVGVGIAAAFPPTRAFFMDSRLKDMSRKEVAYHASLRIPVAIALAEEIMFRSALHALFARELTLRSTLGWTSLFIRLGAHLADSRYVRGESRFRSVPGSFSRSSVCRNRYHFDDSRSRALLLPLEVAFEKRGGPGSRSRGYQRHSSGDRQNPHRPADPSRTT